MMTNFEKIISNADELAMALAVAEAGANDAPNEFDKWREWLDEECKYPEINISDYYTKRRK